jgi:hypothetical protein
VVAAHSNWLELIASSKVQFIINNFLSLCDEIQKKVQEAFLSISCNNSFENGNSQNLKYFQFSVFMGDW